MELKSLILGLFFSLGIFAFKNGLGLHYVINQKKKTIGKKLSILISYCGTYAMVFLLSLVLLKNINMLQQFQTWQNFLQTGMYLHGVLALLLAIWGLRLIIKAEQSQKSSHGWLVMFFPCPVCLTVIFLSVSFLLSFFPKEGLTYLVIGYAGFLTLSFMSTLIIKFWTLKTETSAESSLGWAMLFIAVYFFLTILIIPQLSQLSEIYDLASYQGNKRTIPTFQIILILSFIGLAFLSGFILYAKKTAEK